MPTMNPHPKTSIPNSHDGLLEIHLLGLVDFDSALFLQERLVYEISGRKNLDAGLLICEHPPMITLGRDGSRDQILADPEQLAALRIETRWLNRGGGCVVHGPGQLVAYPILPLDRLGAGLLDYRTRLEQSVIDMADELQVAAHRLPRYPGLWCRTGQFAHLGVAVKSWVSYHGLFIDVAPKMDGLKWVHPQPQSERLTSLSVQCGNLVSMNSVRESLARHLARLMGYARTQTYTGHPLLGRQTRRIFVDA
jgi:lipoyl(octanoyl) transferase